MAAPTRCLDAASARPLRAWSGAAASGAAQRFTSQVLDPWCRQWRLQFADVQACDAAQVQASGSRVPMPGVQAFWWLDPPDPVIALHDLMFGRKPSQPEGAPTLAMLQAQEAWADLQRECAQTLHPETPGTGALAGGFAAWSGALALRFRLEGVGTPWSLALQLAAQACAGWAAPPAPATRPRREPAPLQGIGAALADREVPLSVRLSAFELELGSLQELRVGDVLTLPHGLAEPLEVLAHVPAATDLHLCHAHLGARANAKAVELTSRPALPPR